MVIGASDRAIARGMFTVALGLIARNAGPTAAELAIDAGRMPTASTIRALLAIGRGQPWLPALTDALVEVGIAASEDVLRE